MTGDSQGQVPFQTHIELLQSFLAHRAKIVGNIETLLNAQRKPVQYLQDRTLLARHFEDCFFTLAALTPDQSRLRGQLEEAHWASGFIPRQVTGLYNDLASPAEMMTRAFYFWQQTRWPGRSGRVRYAHTLFNLYLIRCLELMSMRLWDSGPGNASGRLEQLQSLLDELWNTSPDDQPLFVRDARWLIPLTQSPVTDELAPYFEVAARVAESLSDDDRVEIAKAHVRMLGGHLTSQIRHYCLKEGVSLDEASVVRRTRTSNALDFAMLIQGLVPLLGAYERARSNGDAQKSFELAGAICQGFSPDPELFVSRIDLLGPYTMIEHVFIATDDDGNVDYTPLGRRHVRLLEDYETLMSRLSKPLCEDCPKFRPTKGVYSPYGAIFGIPSNLLEDMTLKSLQRDAITRFSLEDVFADAERNGNTDGDEALDDAEKADTAAQRLAWVDGWRKLPHIPPDVQKLYDYPRQFAEDIFQRIEDTLRRQVADDKASDRFKTGHLFIVSEDDSRPDSVAAPIPALPVRYIVSSDPEILAAQTAGPCDQTRLLYERQEGYLAVSYETAGGWVGIRKDFLTGILGAGQDAEIAGLPREAADTLRLMCPNLAAPESP